MSAVPFTLMRGGSSRGPVVLASDLPSDPAERDDLLVRLIGRGAAQLDGVGGGAPTTSKVVVVAPAVDDPGVDIHYQVGNVVVGKDLIDFAGTCGNMTSTAALYALEHGWPSKADPAFYVLRNLSTGQRIENVVAVAPTHSPGAPAEVSTRFLDPAGSCSTGALPTGLPREQLQVAAGSFDTSIVDVAHPYLFLDEEQVRAAAMARAEPLVDLVERLRSVASVRLGAVDRPEDAAELSPAVPRAVLVRGYRDDGALEIVAVSMGTVIGSVPVTAALCAAAAARIPGTLLHRPGHAGTGPLRVVGETSEVQASAAVTTDGDVSWASVDRTARTIAEGRAWLL